MSNKIIFQFDDNLEYQKKAVKSVVELFRGLPKTIDSIYAEKIRKTRITEKDPVRNIDIVKGEKLLQNLKFSHPNILSTENFLKLFMKR